METQKHKISLPKIFRFLSISCLIPVVFAVPYLHIVQPLDLFSGSLGLIGLLITFYQLYQAAKSKEYDDLSKHIDRIESDYLREIAEAANVSNDKFDGHQQTINWLIEDLREQKIELRSHIRAPGHAHVLGELAKAREELAELKAAIAMLTQFGEMSIRVKRLEGYVQKGGDCL